VPCRAASGRPVGFRFDAVVMRRSCHRTAAAPTEPNSRRREDSNLWWTCIHDGFQNRCLRPLGHSSKKCRSGTRICQAVGGPSTSLTVVRWPSSRIARQPRCQRCSRTSRTTKSARTSCVTETRWHGPIGTEAATSRGASDADTRGWRGQSSPSSATSRIRSGCRKLGFILDAKLSHGCLWVVVVDAVHSAITLLAAA
jgi:hypothetical protein